LFSFCSWMFTVVLQCPLTPALCKFLYRKLMISNCKLYWINKRISILLPVPSEPMLSYKLSLPVRSGGHNDSRFFYILYWFEERNTTDSEGVSNTFTWLNSGWLLVIRVWICMFFSVEHQQRRKFYLHWVQAFIYVGSHDKIRRLKQAIRLVLFRCSFLHISSDALVWHDHHNTCSANYLAWVLQNVFVSMHLI